ncbi:acyl-CoA dehydrogenase FadE22 domain protein [Mycobacterium xenopi 4042]|uniref:Acyl-CoA dehydrogenase FadE22 domain protein n=1 Tax=Mycobacterium xenopi 4042 TaxID=1299334 RepID=X8AI51_MYCXE|nr:acyl-CoA dehydrogenase FadE22 domain protein [Mycobacterium xenopi 4042]
MARHGGTAAARRILLDGDLAGAGGSTTRFGRISSQPAGLACTSTSSSVVRVMDCRS